MPLYLRGWAWSKVNQAHHSASGAGSPVVFQVQLWSHTRSFSKPALSCFHSSQPTATWDVSRALVAIFWPSCITGSRRPVLPSLRAGGRSTRLLQSPCAARRSSLIRLSWPGCSMARALGDLFLGENFGFSRERFGPSIGLSWAWNGKPTSTSMLTPVMLFSTCPRPMFFSGCSAYCI